MRYNDEQLKYISDCLKLTALGQLAFIGYASLQQGRYLVFVITALIAVIGVAAGVWVLGQLSED